REDLIERLLALVPTAGVSHPGRAGAPDRVELVDEDDRRRCGLRLTEQVTHAGGADSDDRLDELRRRHGEEGCARLPGHRPGEQRLAGPRRTAEQDSTGDSTAEPPIAVRVLEEVDDLGEL